MYVLLKYFVPSCVIPYWLLEVSRYSRVLLYLSFNFTIVSKHHEILVRAYEYKCNKCNHLLIRGSAHYMNVKLAFGLVGLRPRSLVSSHKGPVTQKMSSCPRDDNTVHAIKYALDLVLLLLCYQSLVYLYDVFTILYRVAYLAKPWWRH